MTLHDDVRRLAQNVARNQGWHVFPCRDDKSPACPHGFKDATRDSAAITDLWHCYPGPLIGVATGAASGFDALDVDAGRWPTDAKPDLIARHEAARAWWHTYADRIPATRTYETASGGLHLYFQHAAGVSNTASRIAAGIDTRGDGGYVVFWFAAGFACHDPSEIAPWPAWLLSRLLHRPAPPASRVSLHGTANGAIDGALRLVATAPDGQRNTVLHWASCRLGERVRMGQISAATAETLLIAAASAAGLTEPEARATARSGLRRTTP